MDEALFLDWLDKQDNFACLPREMREPPEDVFDLGSCQSAQLIIFLKEFRAEVLGNIQPLKRKDLYHVYPKDGLCIEWDRTKEKTINEYCAGRFFYEKRNAGWPDSAKKLNKHFSKILKHVKEVSPKCSVAKFPIYIGEDLEAKQLTGNVRVIFASGKKIQFGTNKFHKQ